MIASWELRVRPDPPMLLARRANGVQCWVRYDRLGDGSFQPLAAAVSMIENMIQEFERDWHTLSAETVFKDILDAETLEAA